MRAWRRLAGNQATLWLKIRAGNVPVTTDGAFAALSESTNQTAALGDEICDELRAMNFELSIRFWPGRSQPSSFFLGALGTAGLASKSSRKTIRDASARRINSIRSNQIFNSNS